MRDRSGEFKELDLGECLLFMEKSIKIEIDNILKETTQLDFPLFANEEKKRIILQEKKSYIEKEFKTIAPELFPDEEKMKKIWKESVEYADEQFKSLSTKRRLNGFYLQELMHYYAEKLGDCIMAND